MANTLLVIKNHLLLFFILLLLGLAACENEESCVTSNSNEVKFIFYKIDDTTALVEDNVLIKTVQLSDDRGFRYEDDSIFRPRYAVPLDPTDTTASFIFTFADGSQRTIALRYDREQSLISPECGPDQRYFNLDTLFENFDSLRLINREVGKFDGANIEIFTCQNNLYTDSIFLSFFQLDTARQRTADVLLDRSITDAQGQVLFSPDSVSRVGIRAVPNQSTLTLFINQLDSATGQITETQELVLSYQQEEKRSGDARQCQLQTRYYDLDTVRTTLDSIRFIQDELTLDNSINIEILDTIP